MINFGANNKPRYMFKQPFTFLCSLLLAVTCFSQEDIYLKNGKVIPELVHQKVRNTASYSIDENRVLIVSDDIQLVTYNGRGQSLTIEDKNSLDGMVYENIEAFVKNLQHFRPQWEINTVDGIIYVVTSKFQESENYKNKGFVVELSKYDATTFEEIDSKIKLYDYMYYTKNKDFLHPALWTLRSGPVSIIMEGEYCLITHESIRQSSQSRILMFQMKTGSTIHDQTFKRSTETEGIRFGNTYLTADGIGLISITTGEYVKKESNFINKSTELLILNSDKSTKELEYDFSENFIRNIAIGAIESGDGKILYSTNLYFENDQFVFRNFKVRGEQLEEINSYEVDPSVFIKDFYNADYFEKKKGKADNFISSSTLYPKPIGTNTRGTHSIISFTQNYWSPKSTRSILIISYDSDGAINSVDVHPYIGSMTSFVPHVWLAQYDVEGSLNVFMNSINMYYSKEFKTSNQELKNGLCRLIIDQDTGKIKSRTTVAANVTYQNIGSSVLAGSNRTNHLYQYMHYLDNETILSVYRRDLTTNSYNATYYLLYLD